MVVKAVVLLSQIPGCSWTVNHPRSVCLPLAALTHSIGIFTLTSTSHHKALRYFRLLLAIPCCAFWIVATFPTDAFPRTLAMWYTMGALGFMRTWDILITGFWDKVEDIPRWVRLDWSDEKARAKGEPGRMKLPLPTTLGGRLAYTMDTLLTVRGSSFFQDTAFDWAPKEIYSYRSPGRKAFILERLRAFFVELVILNVTELLVASYGFDSGVPYPMTTQPQPQQILYTFTLAVFILAATFVPIHAAVPILVMLGFDPNSWAPTWRSVFNTHSLSDFWTYRWHMTFRRVFWRIPLPFVEICRPYISRKFLKIIRALSVFFVSTIYHLCIPLATEDPRHYIVFLQWGMIKFFMSQPVGLWLEDNLVNPLTERWPGRWKALARRTYFWVWIVWTGRWFCDAYICFGLFTEPPALQPLNDAVLRLWYD